MAKIMELSDGFGIALTLCSNVETVCDGRSLEPFEIEATGEAVRAAGAVVFAWLGAFADEDSFFPHWHGGRHDRADIGCGIVAANLYRREKISHDGEEDDWGDWLRCGRDGVPEELLATVEERIGAIDDAAQRKLAECESAAEENAAQAMAEAAAERAAEEAAAQRESRPAPAAGDEIPF